MHNQDWPGERAHPGPHLGLCFRLRGPLLQVPHPPCLRYQSLSGSLGTIQKCEIKLKELTMLWLHQHKKLMQEKETKPVAETMVVG